MRGCPDDGRKPPGMSRTFHHFLRPVAGGAMEGAAGRDPSCWSLRCHSVISDIIHMLLKSPKRAFDSRQANDSRSDGTGGDSNASR